MGALWVADSGAVKATLQRVPKDVLRVVTLLGGER